MDQIAYLADLGINTANRARAIQTAKEVLSDANGCRQVINELTGANFDGDDNQAKMTLLYLVQDIVSGQKTDSIDQASMKANKFITNNPWAFVEPEYKSSYVPKSTVDALGKPKKKKGAKKAAAIKFWNDNQGTYTTRKDWINAIAEHVGLTPAGAATYYHNLKTGQFK